MKKQTTAILLLAAMLAATACGSSGSPDTTGASEDTTTAQTTAAEDTRMEDGLGVFDFEGDTFDILTRYTPLFYPYLEIGEETGDVLNDAVYRRNRTLEERFNFKFTESYYDYAVEGNDHPRQLILSGDDTYDLYIGRCINMFNYAAEGMLVPVEEIPHIDTDKPYWNAQMYENLQVMGTHYFAIGDFNLSAMDFTHVMLFNKEMAKDYQLEDLYQLVRDGKWTYDKFAEVGKKVTVDLDGNTTMDENDQYGYVSHAKQVMPSFWIAAGVNPVGKDEDGALVYTAPNDEKLLEVFQKIYEITWDEDVWHSHVPSNDMSGNDPQLTMFKENQALFANASCFQITSMMRDSDAEFGILPYPKWDENQEKYYSRIEGCELFGVTYTNQKLEMAGVILEAMACESYNVVSPAYYDVTLKVKGTRDEESAEMLDIVFENRVFDYGDTLLCTELRDGIIRTSFINNDRDLVSALTSVTSKCESTLKRYNEGFAKVE